MNEKRIFVIGQGNKGSGPVVYWMSRDQRMHDNWALLYAQQQAIADKVPLLVLFCLVPNFLGATIRQYGFMLKGLSELEKQLHKKNISFVLETGQPGKVIPRLIWKLSASCLITDFDPLRIKRVWKKDVAKNISIPFYEVDAHNIVPCRIASSKQEYAAYTIRPKIYKLLPEFLEPFPSIKKHPYRPDASPPINWQNVYQSLRINHKIPEVDWIQPGEENAKKALHDFIKYKLDSYSEQRNDPAGDGQSHLSPYLHFGQLSAQRTALEVRKFHAPASDKEAFLEELIIRRELSDNYCFYNKHYDSFEGFPSWSQQSLNMQRNTPREYIYRIEELEQARTHDMLWNAAQIEMVAKGKMHGYMRMYWAKKILEWSESPERALEAAIYLNDKYELDGRDPNGYTGIAWSIGGVHDRAWGQRPVFGKVRYMSYNGCRSKFNIKKYITDQSPA